ncbi:hypothetical protein SAMN05192548_103254 [Paraburkholderia terricola]|jgi:hypothetical protein|uniref:Uncharacterized protein n=1 Tax=Paraburkholderia terricola TaxID=169427 RepID=A0A1M6UFT5_9BURK|nr:hypothetical protein SAMN05192547_103254 [Paraburkholderia sediminicola]SHK68074.1 hypothetical protein SAMN05192548_103254 [Paraburkholderia terricola]
MPHAVRGAIHTAVFVHRARKQGFKPSVKDREM